MPGGRFGDGSGTTPVQALAIQRQAIRDNQSHNAVGGGRGGAPRADGRFGRERSDPTSGLPQNVMMQMLVDAMNGQAAPRMRGYATGNTGEGGSGEGGLAARGGGSVSPGGSVNSGTGSNNSGNQSTNYGSAYGGTPNKNAAGQTRPYGITGMPVRPADQTLQDRQFGTPATGMPSSNVGGVSSNGGSLGNHSIVGPSRPMIIGNLGPPSKNVYVQDPDPLSGGWLHNYVPGRPESDYGYRAGTKGGGTGTGGGGGGGYARGGRIRGYATGNTGEGGSGEGGLAARGGGSVTAGGNVSSGTGSNTSGSQSTNFGSAYSGTPNKNSAGQTSPFGTTGMPVRPSDQTLQDRMYGAPATGMPTSNVGNRPSSGSNGGGLSISGTTQLGTKPFTSMPPGWTLHPDAVATIQPRPSTSLLNPDPFPRSGGGYTIAPGATQSGKQQDRIGGGSNPIGTGNTGGPIRRAGGGRIPGYATGNTGQGGSGEGGLAARGTSGTAQPGGNASSGTGSNNAGSGSGSGSTGGTVSDKYVGPSVAPKTNFGTTTTGGTVPFNVRPSDQTLQDRQYGTQASGMPSSNVGGVSSNGGGLGIGSTVQLGTKTFTSMPPGWVLHPDAVINLSDIRRDYLDPKIQDRIPPSTTSSPSPRPSGFNPSTQGNQGGMGMGLNSGPETPRGGGGLSNRAAGGYIPGYAGGGGMAANRLAGAKQRFDAARAQPQTRPGFFHGGMPGAPQTIPPGESAILGDGTSNPEGMERVTAGNRGARVYPVIKPRHDPNVAAYASLLWGSA